MKNTNLNFKLSSNYIVGFINAEGCFNISISKHSKTKSGYTAQVKMHITQSTLSVNVLYAIKEYFGCGSIVIHNKSEDRMRYQITGIKEIQNTLIPFLDQYPLLTSKHLNYLDFKKAVEIIANKEHLTTKGLETLRILANNMNTGRSFEDKYNFSKEVINNYTMTPEWIQGFVDGEGCFGCHLVKDTNQFKFYFSVSQSTTDRTVLQIILDYFNEGYVYPNIPDNTLKSVLSVSSVSNYKVNSESHLNSIIIPFFDKYPLYSNKSLDYQD